MKAFLCLAIFWIVASDIIIPPIKNSGVEIALIYIQGAMVKADAYKAPAQAVQQAGANSNFKIWVGIPEFALNTPDPLTIGNKIDTVLKTMKSQGMQTDKVFITAHSLGGIIAQDYVYNHSEKSKGLILTGSFILRKRRSLDSQGRSFIDFKTPILTIGGEKDGLTRISRIAESYWSQVQNIHNSQSGMFPVVLLEGVTHNQFASGDPPSNVKANDLKPEVAYEDAHKQIADATVKFMIQVSIPQYFDYPLKQKIQDSEAFLTPLIKSYQYEGSYHYKPACFDEQLINPNLPNCTQGSKWIEYAQSVMGGLDETRSQYQDQITVSVNDNSHRVYTVSPVHIPKIVNFCNETKGQACVVKIITVSQSYTEKQDDFLDAGIYPTSADEIRAKLQSRQSIFQAAGRPYSDFDKLDGPELCRQINQEAYNWAVKNAGVKTLQRYLKVGQSYVMGADQGPYNAGIEWILKALKYVESSDKSKVEIQSPMMKTDVNYWIQSAAGYHYCKLLSPARVMEWIYTDSLKAKDGIKNFY